MILYKIVYEEDHWLAEKGDTVILGSDFDDCKAGERCTIIETDTDYDSQGDPQDYYLKVINNLGNTAWINAIEDEDDITIFRNVKI